MAANDCIVSAGFLPFLHRGQVRQLNFVLFGNWFQDLFVLVLVRTLKGVLLSLFRYSRANCKSGLAM
jgi:hypothetical protein